MRLQSIIDRIRGRADAEKASSAEYWTGHMVAHARYTSIEQSLHHFHWRNAQYPGYIDLMPVMGQDHKVVLDYGCGPGNDLIGFSTFSSPARLLGVDVSSSALDEARARLDVHGKFAELILVEENQNHIPLASESVDYIHSSGVLHHCANLPAVLQELHRILKPDGELAVMVYNYESIWLHLYVAWMVRIKQGLHRDVSLLDAFRRTTDGPDCPISFCYTPPEFEAILARAGFVGELTGASTSVSEMQWLRERYDALQDIRLPAEHRDFLANLTFDEHKFPMNNGQVAGINACFRFRKAT